MKKIIQLILNVFLVGIPLHQSLAQSHNAKSKNTEIFAINNPNGDSTAMRRVTVKENVANSIIASICTNDTYFFGTQAITTAGTYMQTFATVNNGDSIVTLYLTVNPNVTSTVSLTLCPDQLPFTWNGITIPTGTTSNAAFVTYSTFNTLGCDSTITLNLTINQSDVCCTLLMPNAFTPNGDGLNDKFGPAMSSYPPNYSMRIYNHWGQMVYVSNKEEQKWDGTYNGHFAEPGIYFYTVTGYCMNRPLIQMKGDIILIR